MCSVPYMYLLMKCIGTTIRTITYNRVAQMLLCGWLCAYFHNVQNYDLASLQSALSWQSKQLVAKSLQISDPERAGDASNEAVCGGAKYLCWTPSLFIKEIASQSWLKIIYWQTMSGWVNLIHLLTFNNHEHNIPINYMHMHTIHYTIYTIQ